MTNLRVAERKALRDEILLTTVRRRVPTDGTLDLVIDVATDSDHDFFIEIAEGSAKFSAHFQVSDDVGYTGGDLVPISTSVIDGNEYGGDDVSAKTNTTINSKSTRYQTEIAGGQTTATGRASGGNFTQALLKIGQTYSVEIINDDGANWSTINIKLWRVNGAS